MVKVLVNKVISSRLVRQAIRLNIQTRYLHGWSVGYCIKLNNKSNIGLKVKHIVRKQTNKNTQKIIIMKKNKKTIWSNEGLHILQRFRTPYLRVQFTSKCIMPVISKALWFSSIAVSSLSITLHLLAFGQQMSSVFRAIRNSESFQNSDSNLSFSHAEFRTAY